MAMILSHQKENHQIPSPIVKGKMIVCCSFLVHAFPMQIREALGSMMGQEPTTTEGTYGRRCRRGKIDLAFLKVSPRPKIYKINFINAVRRGGVGQ
jgi:hypothetical protein